MKDDANNSFEIKGVNGGRDRTRTCDLLRVKRNHAVSATYYHLL